MPCRLTAGMPLTRCARGPTPVTVGGLEASNRRAATGRHLTVPPAAREALSDADLSKRKLI